VSPFLSSKVETVDEAARASLGSDIELVWR
jgi:hypothetical protein